MTTELNKEPVSPQRPTIKKIQQTVADYFDISIKTMNTHNREIKYARPRQIAMYLTHKILGYQYTKIAMYFGGRDHTTVIHAVKVVSCLLENKPDIRVAIGKITESLNSIVPVKTLPKPAKKQNENEIENKLDEVIKRLTKIEKLIMKWE